MGTLPTPLNSYFVSGKHRNYCNKVPLVVFWICERAGSWVWKDSPWCSANLYSLPKSVPHSLVRDSVLGIPTVLTIFLHLPFLTCILSYVVQNKAGYLPAAQWPRQSPLSHWTTSWSGGGVSGCSIIAEGKQEWEGILREPGIHTQGNVWWGKRVEKRAKRN